VNVALETGGVLVSDKVTLEFEVSLIKTARLQASLVPGRLDPSSARPTASMIIDEELLTVRPRVEDVPEYSAAQLVKANANA
jgi:hypothetical protein